MSTNTTTNGREKKLPFAMRAMTAEFRSRVANAFIMYGNVRDYVMVDAVSTGRLIEFLPAYFAKRDIIVVYDRANGIQFPRVADRQRFIELVGTGAPAMDPAFAAVLGSAQGNDELPTDPAVALPLLGKLLRSAEAKSVVIIDYAEALLPATDMATMPPADKVSLIALTQWGTDREIMVAENIAILVTAEVFSLHPMIRSASSGWHMYEFPIPALESRREFVDWYLGENIPFDTDLTPAQIANATAGLALVHIEDIFLRASLEGSLTYEMIRERKRSIIAAEYGDVIEVMEPEYGFEAIGGLEHVKGYFAKSVVRPMREGNKNRCPMGVLLTGPAGTGKSAMAVAVARESGINAVKLQIGGKIASMWQGQGERNLEKALTAILALAPTIVFVDEIDQAISRGDGNGSNQQDSRIFQRLMEFMAETTHRGEVVFLAATNRPDRMDAALRRPGRFDKKIPFLVPNGDERRAIFAVMTRRYCAETLAAENIPAAVIAATEGWTGAEIEMACIKANELMYDEGWGTSVALVAAVERVTPSTADIEFMTNIAILECNDADLLPPAYRARLADRKGLEAAAAAQMPTRRGGPQREI